MRVLVTGGCGFLGSHVCEYYAKRGHEVVSYDNMTKHELNRTGLATDAARMYNWNYLEELAVEMIEADIRDHDVLLRTAQGCDYIIHTAAQPAMTISWENPRLDFTSNTLGTFNVLDTARELSIPVACCATIHIYGNEINDTLTEGETRFRREPPGIDEEHPTVQGKLAPLHASKMSGDIYLRSYIDTYGLEAASFRLTGIYGTRQFGGEDHGWVANFAIRTVAGWPISVFGTGKQVRDIVNAQDVCRAFDRFYETRAAGVYNIGGGTETAISLLECIDLLKEISGREQKVEFGPERHGDMRYFICDISKAKAQLGWTPEIMPREGVAELLEWIEAEKHIWMG